MNFRKATPLDSDSILQFWKASGASESPIDTIEQIGRAIEHPTVVFLLAEEEGEIIGSLIGTFDGWRGNMYRMVVHPKHRRKGIGNMLVRKTEEAFAEWGVRIVSAVIENDRPWGFEFWRSVGYHHDEHVTRYIKSLNGSRGG